MKISILNLMQLMFLLTLSSENALSESTQSLKKETESVLAKKRDSAAKNSASKKPIVPLNKSLVKVGNRVLTLRDVQLASAIENWYFLRSVFAENRGAKNQPKKHADKSVSKVDEKTFQVVEGTEDFQKKMDQVIVELLLSLEAEQFSVAKIEPSEVQKTADQFLGDMQEVPSWKAMAFDRNEALQAFERILRARAFMQFLTESIRIDISDDEISKYYQDNRVRFGGFPLSDFRETIRQFLLSRAREEKLRDRVESLKKKFKVRILRPQ